MNQDARTTANIIALLTRAYNVLADIRNDWPGRSTTGGQRLLCDMLDTISQATGIAPQDLQDAARGLAR